MAARDRSAAYDAFEKYETARCGAGASDLCDFVQHVHRGVVAGAVHGGAGCRPTHVFVDEVQDFTPAELELVLAFAGVERCRLTLSQPR